MGAMGQHPPRLGVREDRWRGERGAIGAHLEGHGWFRLRSEEVAGPAGPPATTVPSLDQFWWGTGGHLPKVSSVQGSWQSSRHVGLGHVEGAVGCVADRAPWLGLLEALVSLLWGWGSSLPWSPGGGCLRTLVELARGSVSRGSVGLGVLCAQGALPGSEAPGAAVPLPLSPCSPGSPAGVRLPHPSRVTPASPLLSVLTFVGLLGPW